MLIVGAGFAGASTAFHLARDFGGSILMVEQESIPGFHASGRNASLLLQSTERAEIRSLAAASRQAYRKLGERVGYRATGSLLLGTEASLEVLREPDLVESEYVGADYVLEAVPHLRGHAFDAALLTPGDGVLDISQLLGYYLDGAREAGVRTLLGCRVESVAADSGFRVETSTGTIHAKILVNAAGAWASGLAELAGAAPIPLFPLKRHLFVLEGVTPPDPEAPFVWSLAKDFYFRPESGGLLFSVCDEEPALSLEPTVNAEISEVLAEVIWRELPALQEATQRRVWSCFRTKAVDQSFVIGWDPALDGFFWVAGLGGHGMGTSWEVGRRAAQAILDPAAPLPGEFLPARLLPAGTVRE